MQVTETVEVVEVTRDRQRPRTAYLESDTYFPEVSFDQSILKIRDPLSVNLQYLDVDVIVNDANARARQGAGVFGESINILSVGW